MMASITCISTAVDAGPTEGSIGKQDDLLDVAIPAHVIKTCNGHTIEAKKIALGRVERVRRQHLSTRVSLHGCQTKCWWAHTGPACHALHQVGAFSLFLLVSRNEGWTEDDMKKSQTHLKHISIFENVRVLARPHLSTFHTVACPSFPSLSADSELAD